MARIRLTGILLVLLALALAAPAPAHATFKWQRYNIDPFAQTRDEAMEKRESVFKDAGLSKVCIAAAMQATSEPGKPGRLINGNRLDWMASSNRLNRDVLVALVNIDPGVEASPLTEEWTLTCDGRRLTIVLPQACNNWSGRMVKLVVKSRPRPRPPRHFVREPPPAPVPVRDTGWNLKPFPRTIGCPPNGVRINCE